MSVQGGTRGSGESIAPIIASLVNGFTLYESSIIVLHVRTGTSVFAEVCPTTTPASPVQGREEPPLILFCMCIVSMTKTSSFRLSW